MSDTAVRVTASSTAAATWSRINSVVRGFIELSQGTEGVANAHLLFEVYRHLGAGITAVTQNINPPVAKWLIDSVSRGELQFDVAGTLRCIRRTPMNTRISRRSAVRRIAATSAVAAMAGSLSQRLFAAD